MLRTLKHDKGEHTELHHYEFKYLDLINIQYVNGPQSENQNFVELIAKMKPFTEIYKKLSKQCFSAIDLIELQTRN